MCFIFSDWNPGDYISLLALLVSGLALLLGYIAYNKLLAQEASKAQMKLILDVIDKLNHTPVQVLGQNIEQVGGSTAFITTLFGFSKKRKKDENLQIIYPDNWLNNFENILIEFSDNPLIPKKLHEVLINYRNSYEYHMRVEIPTTERIYLIGFQPYSVDPKVIKFRGYKGGINGFYNFVDAFTSAIQEWLRKQGLKDIDSFVNHQRKNIGE
jgi:hypothetical protein